MLHAVLILLMYFFAVVTQGASIKDVRSQGEGFVQCKQEGVSSSDETQNTFS